MSSRGAHPWLAGPASGPRVARAFQVGLSAIFLVAWLSLGAQVQLLVGSRGLLPFARLAETIAERRPDLAFADFPTWLRYFPSDTALAVGIALGVLLSLLSLFGIAARLAFALGTALYLGYAVACQSFLSFQWDNLLLELGFLAVFLPTHERARWIHFCLRVALFKLYFESGIAKWQSHLGDWQDGSAMTYYYETAPLPAGLAWYAHHLPAWWHHLESWGTLAFELGAPFLAFGPRIGRLACFVVLSAFQVVNIATANYGFFSYLALVLGVMLLDEDDARAASRTTARLLARVRRDPRRTRSGLRRLQARTRLFRRGLARARRRLIWTPQSDEGRTVKLLATLSTATVVGGVYVSVSLFDGLVQFSRGSSRPAVFQSLHAALAPFRIINNYHLFGHITRDRIEPTVQTYDGAAWTTHDLRYKPGDPLRRPPYVAPHQPRVDFLLWFYGLGHRRGTPRYVAALLDRLCHDPDAVQPLFPEPLPDAPRAARIAYLRYHFTTPVEHARTGAWWTRRDEDPPLTLDCRR